jgi:MFS family permease
MVITQGFLLRRLSPRLGEKRLLLVGSVCAAIGYFGIAGAEAVPPLAAAVTLLAVGAGLISPSINGGLSLITRAQDQGLALGSNQSLSALGRVTGPAVGGFLYKAVGSWAPFATAAALSLIVFTLAWRLQRPRSSLSSGATTSTIDPAPSGS